MIRSPTMLLATICLILITGTLSQDELKEAVENEPYTMTCNLGPNIEFCQWLSPVFKKYNGIQFVKPYDGYRVDADAASGKCDLVIDSVKKEDNGEWVCSTPSVDDPVMKTLSVLARPTKNFLRHNGEDITNGIRIFTESEEGESIECVSEGGIPAPTDFEWTVNGMPETPVETKPDPDNKDITISVLKLSFPPENMGGYSDRINPNPNKQKTVACTVVHRAYPSGKSEPISTTVGIRYETTQVELYRPDGNANYIICEADGIPPPEFVIQKQGETPSSWREVFKGSNFTFEESGVYQCVVTYETGKTLTSSPPLTAKLAGGSPEEEHVTDNDANTAKADTGTIVGIVVGALVLLALIGGITMFTFKKKKLCFSGAERHETGQGSAENGVPRPKPEEKRMVSDKKEGSQDAVIPHH